MTVHRSKITIKLFLHRALSLVFKFLKIFWTEDVIFNVSPPKYV